MREIKYQVWDKKDEKWVSANVVVDHSGLLFWFFADTLSLIEDKDRYIVRFFINKKDRNGNEIYEGDIVKHDCGFSGGFGIVEYSDFEGSWFLESLNGNSICYDIKLHEVTVIGNIYENPELLKEAK